MPPHMRMNMFRNFRAFQPGRLSVFVHPCPHGLRAHLLPAVAVAGKEQQRAGCQRLIRVKLRQVFVQHGHGAFCQRNRADDAAFAEKCCSRSCCAEPQIGKMQLQQLANPGAGVIQDGEHGLVSAAFGSGHIGYRKDGPGCVFSQVFHLGKRIILLCLDSGYIQRCRNVFRTAGRSVGNECPQGGKPVVSCGTRAVLLCLQMIQISIERIRIHHIKCDSSQFCFVSFCQIGEELVQRLSVICNGAWTGPALCRKIHAKPVSNQHE